MKKQVLIFAHAMEIGGAEKALLGLLESIDYDRFDVDLFLMRHSGEWLRYLPQNVRLLPEKREYACLAIPIAEAAKRSPRVAALRAVGKAKAAQTVKRLGLRPDNGVGIEYSHKYTLPAMPRVTDKEYDLAISFLTPHYFARERVKAKRYAAWIHTDYTAVDVDIASEVKMWSAYDAIVSISDQVSAAFSKTFPSLESRLVRIDNPLPVRLIRALAEAQDDSPARMPGELRLLSIGRYCTAKNFDNVPDICRRIRESGLNVRWFIIGYGADEALIREKIAETGMAEHVILLGKKENPYPYIKACDVYVQPSRYEGKCVSVQEAQILAKPVVIARYATAASQVEDGVDGFIVPQDNAGCAEGIAKLLQAPERLDRAATRCEEKTFVNDAQLEKLYELVNEAWN